jgi:tripartite-type tricarboxylate transporter receptor subunit TctC
MIAVPCSRILVLTAGLVFGFWGFSQAKAADPDRYPEKTITLYCPWASGGGTDQVSRFIADQLAQRLRSPVIVVNKEGGSGAIGHEAIADAKADGYTLGMITAELSTMHHMGISQKTYRDYTCLTQVNADAAAIIVRKNAPWKTLSDLLDEIKRRPGELKMSGTATGGLWDLARAGMLNASGLEVSSVIWVPTKGSAPSVVQLLGGHIDVVCCSVPEVASQLEAGELRVLAVLSEERLPEFPHLPTAKEQGLDWVAMGWRGLAVPKDTPPAIVDKLAKELAEIVSSDAYFQFMKKLGFGVAVKGPGDFEEFLEEQEIQWKDVLIAAGYIPGDGAAGNTHLDNQDSGPYLLPIALGVVLCVGMLFQLGSWWISRKPAETPSVRPEIETPSSDAEPRNRNVAIVIASLAGYLLLLPRAGFSLSTLLFAGSLMCWFGSRWWTALFAAAVLTAVVRVVFVVLFKVPLPEGDLGLPF